MHESKEQNMGVKFRNNLWYIRFWLDKAEVFMSTKATTKRQAQYIEQAVKNAIRTGIYGPLDDECRAVCIRYFKNRKLRIPESLLLDSRGTPIQTAMQEELTLERAANMCYDDPDVQRKSALYRERFKQCCTHILAKLGSETPVRSISVRDVKQYCKDREDEGASASTINKEKAVLSKTFRHLVENDLLDKNPASLVKSFNESMSRRRVYIGREDFVKIVESLPAWYRPLAWTAYYTGMRQGEVRNLTRNQVDIEHRMIRLTPGDTKERRWKSVPIHQDLVPVLRQALSGGHVLGIGNVFLREGSAIPRTQLRRYWESAVRLAGYPDLHFHDIRHTFKVNCRASGIDEEIRRYLMGHANRAGSVHENYGILGDKELVRAIDQVTFGHGHTDIWTARKKKNPAGATTGAFVPSVKTGSEPGLAIKREKG
jgi:integrase